MYQLSNTYSGIYKSLQTDFSNSSTQIERKDKNETFYKQTNPQINSKL